MRAGLHTFHIKQRHIRNGSKKDAFSCPISLCAKEDGFIAVNTYHKHIVINCRVYRLPAHASLFVSRFDDGLPVDPFSFTLNILPAIRP